MENTPTWCAGDLPSILEKIKNDPKSRSVNNPFQQLDFDPNCIKDAFYQAELRPGLKARLFQTSQATLIVN